MFNPAPWHQKYTRMLCFSLLLGILGQYLFIGHFAGVSIPLFLIAFYGLLFFAAGDRMGGLEKWRGRHLSGWILFLPISLLALCFILFDSSFLRGINGLLLLFLITAQAMLLTRPNVLPWYRLRFYHEIFGYLFVRPFSFITAPFELLRERLVHRDKKEVNASTTRKLLTGVLLAAPLLAVVLVLLSSADPVFFMRIHQFIDWIDQVLVSDIAVRTTVGGAIALYVFCFIWALLFWREPQMPYTGSSSSAEKKAALQMDPITMITLLVCINIIYILFAILQFSHLFSGMQGLEAAGGFFAEYARRGFSELIVISAINMGLLLIGLHFVRESSSRLDMLRRVLLSVLLVCTMVLLVSAFGRLYLYIEAYGYTRLRLLAQGFMVYFALLLLLSIVRIWYNRIFLAKAAITLSLVCTIALNFINMDGIVARHNVQQPERIDIAYLSTLSADASPGIREGLRKHPELAAELEPVLELIAAKGRGIAWQSWNYSLFREAIAD